MKAFSVLIFFISVAICSAAQNSDLAKGRLPILDKDGYQGVSFVNDNIHFQRDSLPPLTKQYEWHPNGWRGEKIHTQVLVWTERKINNLKVKLFDLFNTKGGIIRAINIKAGFVGYVLTDHFIEGCNLRNDTLMLKPVLVADPIDNLSKAVSVDANAVQPIWLSIQVPTSARVGKYKGKMLVLIDNHPHQLNIILDVPDKVLPQPYLWKYDLDLWQHPAAVARVAQVELWSDGHFKHMAPYMTMLAQAGQKCITASIIDEPWGHQVFDDYPSLIKWTKKTDGSWNYDYTVFDKYILFAMHCGITKRINCFSMVPWSNNFRYYDEAAKKDIIFNAAPGSEPYSSYWKPMLEDFTKHLKRKGWFSKTCIALDERPLENIKPVISLLKTVDRHWKIKFAGVWHPEIEKDIFDYSIASRLELPQDILKRRLKKGCPSTYYTCCVEELPNGFTFSPPAENAWLGWYAAAKGFSGYLRWAYNSWTENPMSDSRFRAWPGGDTYQIYPGPKTSIRFEKLIEGIQDYEKIQILSKEFSKSKDVKSLKQLENILYVFNIDSLKETSAVLMLETAKRKLDVLTKRH